MKAIIHRNVWNWGRSSTIVLGGGIALVGVSVEDDDTLTGWIHSLKVLEKWQGRGYGRALMAQALKEAGRYNVKRVCLQADAPDWVVEWYKRCGFVFMEGSEEFMEMAL